MPMLRHFEQLDTARVNTPAILRKLPSRSRKV